MLLLAVTDKVTFSFSDCNVTNTQDVKPELLCEDHQIVIRWPSDTMYSGTTATLPADVADRLLQNIATAGKDIFKIVLASHSPP